MNRTQSLCAFFGRFGCQRIAQYQFGNFVVAPFAEAFIDIGRPCFVSGFRKFEFRVLGMKELRQTSGVGRILHGPLAGLVVVGVIDIFLYGHAEYLGELCPVARGVTFVDDPRCSLGQQPQIGR